MRLRQTEIVWRELDDRLVLLDLRSSQYFEVNGTGAFIVRQLLNDVTESGLAQLLIDEFKLPADAAERDVSEFVQHLTLHELLDRD